MLEWIQRAWGHQTWWEGVQEAEKNEDLPQRLSNINDHFTHSLYVNICRSLFEKDKLLFSLLLAARIMLSQRTLSAERFSFLLTGGVGTAEASVPNPAPCATLPDRAVATSPVACMPCGLRLVTCL